MWRNGKRVSLSLFRLSTEKKAYMAALSSFLCRGFLCETKYAQFQFFRRSFWTFNSTPKALPLLEDWRLYSPWPVSMIFTGLRDSNFTTSQIPLFYWICSMVKRVEERKGWNCISQRLPRPKKKKNKAMENIKIQITHLLAWRSAH